MKIAIIGAGPSGMMAAIAAKNKNNEVHIFDKNEKIGKKLFITGKGRCNITNNKSMSEVMENICTNKKFLFSSFNVFTNIDIINLLESYGLKTKVERGDRVFPESDKSSDVLKTFEKILKDKKVKVHLHSEITEIKHINGHFTLKGNLGYELGEMAFDRLVIATGGVSYPTTGSTGDGHVFATSFGHKIINLKPALTGIILIDGFVKELKGISLRNVSLGYTIKNKKHLDFGELVFTDKGISGPIVLSASSKMTKDITKVKDLFIDLKAALDMETLDKRMIRELSENPTKNISNILEKLTIKALVPIILEMVGIDKEVKAHQITKAQRREITETFKRFKLSFKSLDDVKYAIITSGGINVKEINPSTMESKLVKGLYFAGELLDVDAYTGGYNLQIAYSTGYLAGISCSNGGENV